MAKELEDNEAGALQVGPTDQGMVRFIIQTRTGVLELDFEPDEAVDIADELLASAERARGAARPSGATPATKRPDRRRRDG